MISTREEDLVGMHRMGSIAALENYAEGTASQLLYLQVNSQPLLARCKQCGNTGLVAFPAWAHTGLKVVHGVFSAQTANVTAHCGRTARCILRGSLTCT